MGVVWCRELPKERSISSKYRESPEYSRAWLVRTDSPNTSLGQIRAAAAAYRSAHPENVDCKALDFTTQAADDSGLLFVVRAKYKVPAADDNEEEEDEGEEEQNPALTRNPVWSGSSTVRSVPIYKDKAGAIITNSAGDPLEGLEGDEAEFRLTLTDYSVSHVSWMNRGRLYTNSVNSDVWNGGAARTWKCQGLSAQLQTVNKEGTTFIFWEITTEFAYRADTWDLKPWDIGFHERVTDDGTPSQSGTKRRAIVGQDKKPVKQPVALANGVALPAGTPPNVINNGAGVQIYESRAFIPAFGEIYTPGVANE